MLQKTIQIYRDDISQLQDISLKERTMLQTTIDRLKEDGLKKDQKKDMELNHVLKEKENIDKKLKELQDAGIHQEKELKERIAYYKVKSDELKLLSKQFKSENERLKKKLYEKEKLLETQKEESRQKKLEFSAFLKNEGFHL